MAYAVRGMTRVRLAAVPVRPVRVRFLPVLVLPVLLMLTACAGSSPDKIPATRPEAAAADWRDLLVAPFGSARKDIHRAMHETFLFDAVPGASMTSADNKSPEPAGVEASSNLAATDEECFSLSRDLPQMFRIAPDSYVLCFYHDHLVRVEASLPVASLKVASVWEEICSRVAKLNPETLAEISHTCEGRHASVIFRAAWPDASLPNDASAPNAMPPSSAAPQIMLLSVTLYDESYLPQ